MLKTLSSTCDGKADDSGQIWPLSRPNSLILSCLMRSRISPKAITGTFIL